MVRPKRRPVVLNPASRPDSERRHEYTLKIAVAQMGARRHYAVPRILYSAGLLGRLFTDICAVKGWPAIFGVVPPAALPASLRRLRERVPTGIPVRCITTFDWVGLQYAVRRSRTRNNSDLAAVNVWAGAAFCRCVVRHGIEDFDAAYAFNGAALELLVEARRRGKGAILEQTNVPRSVEEELLQRERERFPDWESVDPFSWNAQAFAQREADEWEQASLILCGSKFVVDGISRLGGPVDRCVVVPYGFLPVAEVGPRPSRARELRVVTVGAVALRKGTGYVLDAARALGSAAVFRLVGPVTVPSTVVAGAPPNVEFVGVVPRSAVASHLSWADVMLLPSVCEGSAVATYEALAHGVPVVCTPNTGSVVQDGVEGFVVPCGSVEAIVEAIARLARDRELLAWLSSNAVRRAGDYDLDHYAARLVGAVAGRQSGASATAPLRSGFC